MDTNLCRWQAKRKFLIDDYRNRVKRSFVTKKKALVLERYALSVGFSTFSHGATSRKFAINDVSILVFVQTTQRGVATSPIFKEQVSWAAVRTGTPRERLEGAVAAGSSWHRRSYFTSGVQ